MVGKILLEFNSFFFQELMSQRSELSCSRRAVSSPERSNFGSFLYIKIWAILKVYRFLKLRAKQPYGGRFSNSSYERLKKKLN